jgi:2-desacetyl-2-hydroxyethyl bacteriochlorophyllide A dehydrogenase
MQKLLIVGARQIRIDSFADEPLNSTSIRIRSLYNGISHGTEMNFYRGTAPHITKEIHNGLFSDSQKSSLVYPIWHGYETVGEVVEVGKDVKDFKVGDIAWTGNSHADYPVCDTTINGRPFFCERAPEGADPVSGIFLALGGVAYDGYLTSKLRLGETGIISGLGCIGLLCVQFLANSGIHPIIAIDPLEDRRNLALRFGADYVIDPTKGQVAEQIMEINKGNGADAVIETSGNWKALHEAIRCCASKYGRVVALGFYQGNGDGLRLGEEFHHSSFYPMGASSILAINYRDEPAPGRAWDRIRVYHIMAEMLGSGKIKTDGLLTHRFSFSEAQKAFDLVDKHPEKIIKVILTF